LNDLKVIELYKTNNLFTWLSKSEENIALLDFSEKLKFTTRFFNNNHPVFKHIKKLFELSTIIITPEDLLYRARKIKNEDNDIYNEKNNKINIEDFFYGYDKKNSFVCLAKDVQANRTNSAGIPCLYTAREEKTAISEILPFIGTEISVARIRPSRNLKLFDLYFHPNQYYNDVVKPPRSDFWLSIAIKFSIPYEDTSFNEYLFTQCLSEYFKQEGFDGIQYSSSLNEGGKNIAIFNCKHEDDGGNYDICEPICSDIVFIRSINYSV
jgi:hypothetical protein